MLCARIGDVLSQHKPLQHKNRRQEEKSKHAKTVFFVNPQAPSEDVDFCNGENDADGILLFFFDVAHRKSRKNTNI